MENDKRIKIMKKNILHFLNNIVTEKLNNREDAKYVFLKNIFGYKITLEREKIYPGSRTQSMRGFIETDI